LAGVLLDQVSILLGHKSIKTTDKHYSPFVKARQEQLVEAVKKAWITTIGETSETDRAKGRKNAVASRRVQRSSGI